MAMSLEAAAAAMRDAMRETVKRYSLWYLLQGVLMAVAGVLALIYRMLILVAMMVLLCWSEGGVLVFTVLLLVYFMVEGISKVIFGLTIRPLSNWGWVFGSGVV